MDEVVSDLQRVKTLNSQAQISKQAIEDYSWRAYILAYSGKEEHKAFMSSLVGMQGDRLDVNIEQALGEFDLFSKWAPIIGKGIGETRYDSLDTVRLENGLNSGDDELTKRMLRIRDKYYPNTRIDSIHDDLAAHSDSVPTKNELEAFAKYNSGKISAKELAAITKWSGLYKHPQFDKIYDQVKADISNPKVKNNIKLKKSLRWRLMILGYTGRLKYLGLIEDVRDIEGFDSSTKKYIKKSFKESAQFRLWNPIISREINDSDKDDIAEKRIINMLTSDEPKLHRAAAVIASREHIYTQGVAKQMNDYVQQNFANSEVRTDTLLYCIDVIEKSEYKDAMQTMKLVSLSASSAKLSSAARRAYNKLKRI